MQYIKSNLIIKVCINFKISTMLTTLTSSVYIHCYGFHKERNMSVTEHFITNSFIHSTLLLHYITCINKYYTYFMSQIATE